jgi:putative glutamine amidotransferase
VLLDYYALWACALVAYNPGAAEMRKDRRRVRRARKPVIGVTPLGVEKTYDDSATFVVYGAYGAMVRAVTAAGGIPLVIPPESGDVKDVLDAIDGLLVTGGDDIDPARYGDTEAHPRTSGIDALRDALELDLVRGAIEREMPMLCICRGIQLLNVALGGTLLQDIPSQYPTEIVHEQTKVGVAEEDPQHSVRVTPGSLLARTYGVETLEVNSLHHQSLRDIAPDLTVNAVAPDEIVESVSLDRDGAAWTLGVQWHPELMFERYDEHLKPFTALVEEASRRA